MTASLTNAEIGAALATAFPGKQWSLSGTDLANFQWLEPTPAPTIEQLNAAVAALPSQETVLSQDLMAQFTADDAAKIQAAVAGNVQLWLLWSSLQAQKDPMLVSNDRFLSGWGALVSVLGQPRMDTIAAALGVTVA